MWRKVLEEEYMRSVFRYAGGGSSGRVQGRYLGCWQELSEEAVRDILEKESLREERAALRGGISFKLR